MQKPPKKDQHFENTRRVHFENGRRTEIHTESLPARRKITPATSGGTGSSRKYAKGTHRHTKKTTK